MRCSIEFSREPDRKFIQWAEQYLSDGKADPCNSKGVSFKNCLVRIPGSYNSENNCQVRIIQRCDGETLLLVNMPINREYLYICSAGQCNILQ